ncbi:GGDEF domain-containing protein [Paenibacillus luteus]|uniref:GGDEF domain-containing protein n=1 Tax=Paenibacillus luteus TaxID=2545753 RepID=UPI0019D6ABC5|nr:GGDEF domain-containing protein [Paenibacillus luteus]
MKTVFILIVLGHLFSIVLITAYWRTHKKDRTLNIFLLAKCLQGMAWLFVVVRGGVPDLITVTVANSLLFAGFSLEAVAMLKLLLVFQRSTKIMYITLTAATALSFHVVVLFHNTENIRIAVASLGTASLLVLPAYHMLRIKQTSLIMKIIGMLYAIAILCLVGRAGIAINFHEKLGFFTPGHFQNFAFLALFLIMFIGNTGFILLLKEKVDQELLRLANHDDLTGILNRRTFVLEANLSIEQHAKSQEHLTLVLFDIDHFKKINDSYGHHIGDCALQELTKHIRLQLRGEDSFGRYGGDEFAILLPRTDEEESDRLVERFRNVILQSSMPDIPHPISISLGVVTIVPNRQTNLESLYKLCDRALYDAKELGRNGAVRTRVA